MHCNEGETRGSVGTWRAARSDRNTLTRSHAAPRVQGERSAHQPLQRTNIWILSEWAAQTPRLDAARAA